MRNYTVSAANISGSTGHMSLVEACSTARASAKSDPGTQYVVERDGLMQAHYQLRAGVMKAWVR